MNIKALSVNEIIGIIMKPVTIIKSILVDDKRLQVGYKDDIRAFLPRSVENVEMQKARMRAAL